jgi:sulfur-oxidizing protein SoxY
MLISTGLLKLRGAWAARPDQAFLSEELPVTLQTLFGDETIADSEDVKLVIADVAENGTVVPVKVTYDPPGIETVYIIAENNPVPLLASFEFAKGTLGDVSTRIKLAESGNVQAIVRANGKLYRASKHIEVTEGGCG